MTGDSSRAAWLRQARSYLRDADPVLARLIDERPEFDPRAWMSQLPPMDLYGALLFQVTGQQLSVAATRRTLTRIEALFGGHLPSPAEPTRSHPVRRFRAAAIPEAAAVASRLTWLDPMKFPPVHDRKHGSVARRSTSGFSHRNLVMPAHRVIRQPGPYRQTGSVGGAT